MKVENSSGVLYLVGVPLGNPEDITLRAVRILREVSLIACEDTRRSGRLLADLGIKNKLTSHHAHTKLTEKSPLISHLICGGDAAYITDGGMPGISDPGADLVRFCRELAVRVVPLPGGAACTTALAASGFAATNAVFTGFLSPKSGKRRNSLLHAAESANTLVCYESPYRVLALLKDIAEIFDDPEVFIGREMTKLHEEYLYGKASEILRQGFTVKGEFTVVINLKKS